MLGAIEIMENFDSVKEEIKSIFECGTKAQKEETLNSVVELILKEVNTSNFNVKEYQRKRIPTLVSLLNCIGDLHTILTIRKLVRDDHFLDIYGPNKELFDCVIRSDRK